MKFCWQIFPRFTLGFIKQQYADNQGLSHHFLFSQALMNPIDFMQVNPTCSEMHMADVVVSVVMDTPPVLS